MGHTIIWRLACVYEKWVKAEIGGSIIEGDIGASSKYVNGKERLALRGAELLPDELRKGLRVSCTGSRREKEKLQFCH